MVQRFLDGAQIAKRIGVGSEHVRRLKHLGKLPEPDAEIGEGTSIRHGWRPETIDKWQRERKSQ